MFKRRNLWIVFASYSLIYLIPLGFFLMVSLLNIFPLLFLLLGLFIISVSILNFRMIPS